MRVFVIGNEDTVLGFSLAGVEGFATDDLSVAAREMENVIKDRNVGILLVTPGIASGLRVRLAEIEAAESGPIVIEVPAPGEKVERPSVRDIVRQAVGVKI